MQFDGLTMRACLTDLRTAAVGGRVQRISQLSPLSVVLDIYAGHSLPVVLSAENDAACLFVARQGQLPPTLPPAPFCTLLRRHIMGARLEDISQHGWDRIALLGFVGRDELGDPVRITLVLETMGKHSNLIAVRDCRVLDAIKRIGRSRSRSRQVLPGLAYSVPPGQDKVEPDVVAAADLRDLAAADVTPGRVAKLLLAKVSGIGPVRAMSLASCLAGSAADGQPAAPYDAVGDGQHAAAEFLAACVRQAARGTEDVADGQPQAAAAAVEAGFWSYLAALLDPAAVPSSVAGHHSEQARLSKLAHAALARVRRRQSAAQEQLASLGQAEEVRAQADTILANLLELRRRLAEAKAAGRQELVVDLAGPEWIAATEPTTAGPTGSMTVVLDAAGDPSAAAQQLYSRYAQTKRSREVLESLLREAHTEHEHLAALTYQLSGHLTEGELSEIAAELKAAGVAVERRPAAHRRGEPAKGEGSQPRRVVSPGGHEVLVGRNNRQNEAILRSAGPNDVWLHARGVPGAHVLLRLSGDRQAEDAAEPAEADLRFAAALAAYHSQARAASYVPVDWCLASRVRKQKGAPPGFVTYTGERTVHVEPKGAGADEGA